MRGQAQGIRPRQACRSSIVRETCKIIKRMHTATNRGEKGMRGATYGVIILVVGMIAGIFGFLILEPDLRPDRLAVVSMTEGSFLQGCEVDSVCYLPQDITILSGTTVTWSNDDGVMHTVTSGAANSSPTGLFDSGIMESGDTFEYTFESAGTYDYHCTLHPWAAGVVIVR